MGRFLRLARVRRASSTRDAVPLSFQVPSPQPVGDKLCCEARQSAADATEATNCLKQYYEEQLAQRAKEELVLTEKRINEVAQEMDFSDEFYFSRFFKKMTGTSPREYRKQNKIS